jgi:hypothetical protein
MSEEIKVTVSTPLEVPIKETETIEITQISKFDNYLNRGSHDDFHGGDICEVVSYLTNKLKSLGHDGSLKIELTRFIHEKTEEIPLSELFPGK